LTIRSHRRQILGAVALGLVVSAVPAAAAEMRSRFSGSLVGFVRGPGGDAQMGATVYLLNKYGSLLHHTLTNERGAFGFDSLNPDSYTVRVLQTSFAPVSKVGVPVLAGERSFLSVQLASLVSSIEIVPPTAAMASLMSDDWKWVLRGSAATRPVLRFDDANSGSRAPRQEVFTETRGMFALIAGDSGSARAASIADMGTAFALSTAVFGSNRVSLSGNVGYSPANGVPAAAFRTSYRRKADADAQFNPETFLSIQQVFLPIATPQRFAGSHMAAASSMSAGIADEVRVTDFLWAKVGVSLDSVTYGSRLSYFSPYALTTLALGDLGVFEFGFSSGIPPAGLAHSQRTQLPREALGDLQSNVNSLAMMPRITLRDGTARVQRSENYEVSYSKVFGSRSISAGYYREGLSNAALTMASPDGFSPSGDIVPDFNSSSGVFNIGDLSRTGVAVAASQSFGEAITLAMIVSRGGVLRTDQNTLASDDPNDIRGAIRRDTQNAISARVAGRAPVLGTLYAASYQWTDFRALTPGHLFLTNLSSPDAGLNISVRQSLPAPPFLSGRMEVSAEMRNMLAQGYLPLRSQTGQRLLLIHTPRALRGGVAFIF
jgi:hypothetical protein